MKLSEILNDKNVFESPKFYAIFAGTGSGKSYWVEQILPQWYDKIYYITSREAKNAQIVADNDNPFTKNNKSNYITANFTNTIQTLKSKSLTFFKQFDCIVIDEVHALFSDSTFAKECFQIIRLIQHLPNVRIIVLTAIIYPYKKYFSRYKAEIIDLTKKCDNLNPETIYLGYKKDIIRKIIEVLNQGKKAALMCNSAKEIATMYLPTFLQATSLNRDEICVLVNESKATEIGLNFPEKDYKYITTQNKLPDNIKLLLTTSKLREGVNILNTDMGLIANESRYHDNILQFFGRFRNYKGDYYLFYDSKENIPTDLNIDLEHKITSSCCEILNSNQPKSKTDPKCIKNQELLIYSYSDNKYMLNWVREKQLEIMNEDLKNFNLKPDKYLKTFVFNNKRLKIVELEDSESHKLREMFEYYADSNTKLYFNQYYEFWDLLKSVTKLRKRSKTFEKDMNNLIKDTNLRVKSFGNKYIRIVKIV